MDIALEERHSEVVEFLSAAGVKVAPSSSRATESASSAAKLLEASIAGNLPKVQELIKSGASVNTANSVHRCTIQMHILGSLEIHVHVVLLRMLARQLPSRFFLTHTL